jgi:hypothetical protein
MKKELFFIKRLILLLITFLMFSFIEKEEEDNSGVTVFEKVYLHLDRHFYLSGVLMPLKEKRVSRIGQIKVRHFGIHPFYFMRLEIQNFHVILQRFS